MIIESMIYMDIVIWGNCRNVMEAQLKRMMLNGMDYEI